MPEALPNSDNQRPQFSLECMSKCPGLQSCAAEFVLRTGLNNEEITLLDVIEEHIDTGRIPKSCSGGPIMSKGMPPPSSSKIEDVAWSTVQRVDAWGDNVVIKCREQGRTSSGIIRPI